MLTITFHGHACFVLEADGHRAIIDPFLTGNPAADISLDRLPRVDAVLLSHGHGDHLGDGVAIAVRDRATLVATYELAMFCQARGATVHAMHIGGGHAFPFGHVKLVPAFHGGRVEGDETGQFTTNPCGLVVTMGGRTVYHCGDTALTVEMQLLAGAVDAMLVPIGDNYTMGIADAVRAVKFVRPRVVIPMHYNTFEVIRADPAEVARQVGARAPAVVLAPRMSASPCPPSAPLPPPPTASSPGTSARAPRKRGRCWRRWATTRSTPSSTPWFPRTSGSGGRWRCRRGGPSARCSRRCAGWRRRTSCSAPTSGWDTTIPSPRRSSSATSWRTPAGTRRTRRTSRRSPRGGSRRCSTSRRWSPTSPPCRSPTPPSSTKPPPPPKRCTSPRRWRASPRARRRCS